MQNRISGLLPCRNDYRLTEIFGYTSKSLPSLEIIGLGAEGKQIKEKFIYITKVLGLKIPRLRYVLCLENLDISKDEKDELTWLELPLLILYFQLAGILPIHKLCDCVATGRVLPSLEIYEPHYESLKLHEKLRDNPNSKLLTSKSLELTNTIPLRDLFKNYERLKVLDT